MSQPPSHPAYAQEVEQLLALWASRHLAFLALDAPSAVYRQGWLSLATPERSSLCSYLSKTMFCWAAKVWCLKVADACHNRHGFSWAERWLEVTAWGCGASGSLCQHSCLNIENVQVSQSTFAHLEITVGKNAPLRRLRTGTWLGPLYFLAVDLTREDPICGLWNDRIQTEQVKPGATEGGIAEKSWMEISGFCVRFNIWCMYQTDKMFTNIFKNNKTTKTWKLFTWHFKWAIPGTVSLTVTWSIALQ